MDIYAIGDLHLPGGADPITVKSGNIEAGAVTREKLADDTLYSPVKYIGSSAVSFLTAWFICKAFQTGGWAMLMLNGGVSFLVSNLVFFLLFFRTRLFKDSLRIVKKTVTRKSKSASASPAVQESEQ